ncbi:hypothetical protein C0992_008140, partial [Termitomyces sp. T32_za158]
MENLFKQAGLNDGQEKKERITDYVDAQTDSEWRGLDSFKEGVSWEVFKKEVLESYPEAVSSVGSVANLDRICREHMRLGQNNGQELHSLMRKFRAEAKKLDGVLSNGVLVTKFRKCLTTPLDELVKTRAFLKYGHYNDTTRLRHRDDPYDLKEIFKVVSILVDDIPESDDDREVPKSRAETTVRIKAEDMETEGKLASLQDGVLALGKEM